MAETVLNVESGKPEVFKATEPAISNVATPGDFSAEFPQPLNPTEVLDLCEEISLWKTIPIVDTGLQAETYREMTSLAFTSGSHYSAFADGACPEEYTHDGSNVTVTLRNIGVKKSLTLSDIKHSLAVQAAGYGIHNLLGGWAASEGVPGGTDQTTFAKEAIAGLKAKEVRLGMTLLINAEDRLLAAGDYANYPYEFYGIENLVTAANGVHSNTGTASSTGTTFSADTFDAFLAESCAKPTHVFGHPTAIQGMLSSYFQLGFQGSQVVFQNTGDRIIPGYNFAGFVNTGIGRLTCVADANFTRTNLGGGKFSASLFALKMNHNGDPLIYRPTQFRMSLVDLVPGCTAISFEIWAKTALIIKAKCAQSLYQTIFSGNIVTTCTRLG